jgi:hypothetical protein
MEKGTFGAGRFPYQLIDSLHLSGIGMTAHNVMIGCT